MPSKSARVGGLTASVVLLAWVCRAEDASVPAALAEYKNALPALQAKYAVVRVKGSGVDIAYTGEEIPNSHKFKFEASRNRHRFKALLFDEVSERPAGVRKIGAHAYLFTPTERIRLLKKPGDEAFTVLRQEKADDTPLDDYLRQPNQLNITLPPFDFPFSGRSPIARHPALLMDDARWTCLEAKDIVVDGKPRRRFHFVFKGPVNPPPVKGRPLGTFSWISLLVAPAEHDALYGYTTTLRRLDSEHSVIYTAWMESEATEDGFPIPKAVKHLRIQTGSEGDKIKLPDGQEVVGRILFQEVETIDSFQFKADPDEAFTLKAF
jgi:hypothetical protein